MPEHRLPRAYRATVIEVRRADNELCGHVRTSTTGWEALAVFGASLGTATTRAGAEEIVRERGLALLSERWTLTGAGDDDGTVCIQEARVDGVRLALGYYSMPGVPTRWIDRAEIESGAMTLSPGSPMTSPW